QEDSLLGAVEAQSALARHHVVHPVGAASQGVEPDSRRQMCADAFGRSDGSTLRDASNQSLDVLVSLSLLGREIESDLVKARLEGFVASRESAVVVAQGGAGQAQ